MFDTWFQGFVVWNWFSDLASLKGLRLEYFQKFVRHWESASSCWMYCYSIDNLFVFCIFCLSSYIIEQGVCYLVLCEAAFPKKLAFAYLEDLHSEFDEQHGKKVPTVSRPYSFIEFGKFFALHLYIKRANNMEKLFVTLIIILTHFFLMFTYWRFEFCLSYSISFCPFEWMRLLLSSFLWSFELFLWTCCPLAFFVIWFDSSSELGPKIYWLVYSSWVLPAPNKVHFLEIKTWKSERRSSR